MPFHSSSASVNLQIQPVSWVFFFFLFLCFLNKSAKRVLEHKTWITLGNHSITELYTLASYFLLQTSGQYFSSLCNQWYSVKFSEAVSYERPRMLYAGFPFQGSDLFSGFHLSLVLGCFSEYYSPLCQQRLCWQDYIYLSGVHFGASFCKARWGLERSSQLSRVPALRIGAHSRALFTKVKPSMWLSSS